MDSVELSIPYLVSYLSILSRLINKYCKIDVTATLASSTVFALNDVTLTCTLNSSISINVIPTGYSWHRVNGDVPSHSSGQDSTTLTIHRIFLADEGEYYCMAELFGHCARSNNVTVIVEGKKLTPIYKCLRDVTKFTSKTNDCLHT